MKKKAARKAPAAKKTARKSAAKRPGARPVSGAEARALVVSLTEVDSRKYDGWDGKNGCYGCGIDAARISETLRRTGFQITALANEKATARAVLKGLQEAAATAKAGDTFFFYFSGHGGQMPDASGDEDAERGGRPGADETLVCYDQELIDDELDKVWLSFPKGSVIYMVSDSCNSGTNFRNLLTQGASPIRPMNRSTERKMKARLLHIGGCRDGFSSFGDGDGGVATNALIRVWAGGAGPQSWQDLFEQACRLITGQKPQLNHYGDQAIALYGARPFSPWQAPSPSSDARGGRTAGSRRRASGGEADDVDDPELAVLSGALVRKLEKVTAPEAAGRRTTRDLGSSDERMARKATRWLMQNFGDKLRSVGADTPFDAALLCAIVCQETAYFWVPLLESLETRPEYRDSPGELADLLVARCVLDASGDYPGTSRGAFPRNTAAFRERYGNDFTAMLIDEANQTRKLRGFSPKEWVYKGYGIFQNDLQAVVENESFFRDREWYDFDRCVSRCVEELKEKYRIVGQDLWEAVRAYNGSGASARQYRDNVRQYYVWTKEEIETLPSRSLGERSLARTRDILPDATPGLSQAELAARLSSLNLDRQAHPLIIVGIRGYYLNTMGLPGVNDRGLYDDAIFIDSPHGFAAYNGNTDPSSRREGHGTGSHKGMARLKPGVWMAHKFDDHCSPSSGLCHPAICQRLAKVTVIRDGEDGADYEHEGMFGINIHRGGRNGTSSAGCQTLHPDQWDSFYALAKDLARRYHGDNWNSVVIPYILLVNES